MSNKNSDTIITLMIGAAIGAGIGILFAPEKGSKTRGKLKNNLSDFKDDAKNKWNSIEKTTKEKFSKSKEELKETVDELLSTSSYKAEEAISYLEEKLAQLKTQNAKLQK